jgi:hypothetical protein
MPMCILNVIVNKITCIVIKKQVLYFALQSWFYIFSSVILFTGLFSSPCCLMCRHFVIEIRKGPLKILINCSQIVEAKFTLLGLDFELEMQHCRGK